MEQQEINSLLEKYQEGTASPAEIDALHNWYREMGYVDGVYPDEELLVKNRIHIRLMDAINPVKKVRLWPRIAAVAAAVALIVLGVYFFNSDLGILKQVQDDVVVNDIAPGRNGATITLGNGQVIQLSDAKSGVVIGNDKLAYNDGSEIDNSSLSRSDISPQGGESSAVAKTAKGQTYIFTLPDGTKVWLNADSKLEFPLEFVENRRRIVKLIGEGYFEVTKDKKRPFIVESKGQTVEVLGTHFNINSYPYEAGVKTTLLEGSVQIIPLQEPQKKKILKPGEQAIVSKQFLKIVPVDVEVATAWKAGKFLFKEEKLESILNRLAYWYDVEIVYEGRKPTMVMSGVIERNRNLSKVLHIIESTTGKVKFRVEGRRVFVMD